MFKLVRFSCGKLLGKKLSSFLLVLFLIFGFTLLLGLEIGKSYMLEITNIVYSGQIGENKLLIEKESSSLSSLFGKITKIKPGFNDDEIGRIEKVSGVKNIFRSSTFSSPAVMTIKMLGTSFTTDVFFEGVDENMINNTIEDFNSNNDYIPLIISEKIIDSLIKIFIKNDNIKNVTKQLILSKEFDITFGKSNLTGSNDKIIRKKGKIVGFGEGSNFIFISVPLKYIEEINKSLGKNISVIDKLFLEAEKNTDLDILQIKIEDLGFHVINPEIEKEKMKNVINLFYKVGLIIVSIIIILITYSLVSFIILRIVESKKDNSTMFMLGIDRNTIVKTYIFESFIISIMGLLFSMPLIYFIIHIVNNEINNYNLIHNFIKLPFINFENTSFISLIIFFIIINMISISFSCYRILRSNLS